MERREIFLFPGFIPSEKAVPRRRSEAILLQTLTNNLAAIADWAVQTPHHMSSVR
jgi:hypothetical protein